MFIALGIMIAGMLLGRLIGGRLSARLLRRSIMGAIFLLLFILGVQIGGDDVIFARLPVLGAQSVLIMLFCVAGSIFASVLLKRLIWNK